LLFIVIVTAITNKVIWIKWRYEGIMNHIRWNIPETGEAFLEFSDNGGAWQHYRSHPLAVTDHAMPRGSKGYATMQRLLKMGYVFTGQPSSSDIT
jgi:hypothetical protein